MPTIAIDWNDNEMKKVNYRLKWKYQLLIENEIVVPVYVTIRFSVCLSDYWLEMKGLVERPCDQGSAENAVLF